jgi:hypothetical protein
MSREYTAVPHEYLEEMDCLSDAEFGRLMRALLYYSMTGEEKELSGCEKAHWKRVRNRENRYQVSFGEQEKAKVERAQRAANARWSKNTDAYACTSNANDAYACTSILSNSKNANTNTDTKANTKANTKAKDIFAAFAAGDVDLLESLRAFEAMRRDIKAPMKTDRAKTMLCNRLQELSNGDHAAMIAMLNEAVLHDWKNVYPPKVEREVKATCVYPEQEQKLAIDGMKRLRAELKGES